MRWTVLIPVKALPAAKSRLLDASVDVAGHERLVRAIRADTCNAARSSADVARLVIVVDQGDGGEDLVFVQTRPGLNAALEDAAAYAAQRWPADGIAALVGDLPALRSNELTATLGTAAAHERAFTADADTTGTTLLAATPGVALRPAFGAGSAGRHAAIATALVAPPGLRRDVDTTADLRSAVVLGVGPLTRAALADADS